MTTHQHTLKQALEAHRQSFNKLDTLLPQIAAISQTIVERLKAGGTLFLFGNGGSASDAQHLAAELVGRFTRERKALPALALNTDSSVLTALANDYAYDHIFKRQLEALLKPVDAVMAISTSGRSANVIQGARFAKQQKALTIGLTNANGGNLPRYTDHCICVPAQETARVQEMHIFIVHCLADCIEQAYAGLFH